MRRILKLRTLKVLLAGAFISLLWASPALAHGELDSSSPAPAEVMQSAPKEIILYFNEAVTPVARSIEMYNEDGQRIVVGEALVSPEDPAIHLTDNIGISLQHKSLQRCRQRCDRNACQHQSCRGGFARPKSRPNGVGHKYR